MISVLFREGSASKFVQEGALQGKPSQVDILKKLDSKCQASAEIRTQYLFFIANVASKAGLSKEPSFFYQIVKELLREHRKYLLFNTR